MDLEQYKKLQAETDAYRNNLESISIEKIVMDRKYSRLWQESIAFEKECVKKDAEIELLKNQIIKLNQEISDLKSSNVEKEIGDLLEDDAA